MSKHKGKPFGIKGEGKESERETEHVRSGKKRRDKMRTKKGRGR